MARNIVVTSFLCYVHGWGHVLYLLAALRMCMHVEIKVNRNKFMHSVLYETIQLYVKHFLYSWGIKHMKYIDISDIAGFVFKPISMHLTN